MQVTLNTPFSWKSANPADLAMLQKLQPNILKGNILSPTSQHLTESRHSISKNILILSDVIRS